MASNTKQVNSPCFLPAIPIDIKDRPAHSTNNAPASADQRSAEPPEPQSARRNTLAIYWERRVCRQINSPGPPVWKVLILDQQTKDVLATVLRVQDLRDAGVTLHV